MLGHHVRMHVTKAGDAACANATSFQLLTHPCMPGGTRLGVSLGMHKALLREAREAEILHSHGLWLWTNFDVYLTSRNKASRVVLSPRGMLEPWALARKRRIKKALWMFGQGAAVRDADCIHVTGDNEYHSVRALGLRNPIAVIPNGVALPAPRDRPTGTRRRLLFLGRIDPVKGIDLLLAAWRRVAFEFLDWDLSIVGPSSGNYLAQMRRLSEELGAPRVEFAPAAFGNDRDEQMASADLFVLPTRSENFGMTVAEALAAGVPVICTKGAPWARLVSERCGYWPEIGVEPLVVALRQALALPRADLDAMGLRGRHWMDAELSWAAAARKMAETYSWLLGRGSAPDFLRRE
jgi:glycosyltransferase involved in cell wall biosynthesis